MVAGVNSARAERVGSGDNDHLSQGKGELIPREKTFESSQELLSFFRYVFPLRQILIAISPKFKLGNLEYIK